MRSVLALALAVSLALAAPAAAQDVAVDVELVLAVDVSRSMTPRELEIQRRGYAEAIGSAEVVDAIRNGPEGRVALTYMEWAGSGSQRTVVDWTLVGSTADARAFAERLTSRFDVNLSRTSISGAIDAAVLSFEGNGFAGWRQVIDVSGDGPNNHGRPVEHARDAALARGIVINGLPLMTDEGMGRQWYLADLDRYYRDCVIGGPAAFVIPVTDWSEFARAVRQKLVLELVHRSQAGIVRAQYAPEQAKYDCLIGERIWNDMMRDWN
jgi:hypothetical protein